MRALFPTILALALAAIPCFAEDKPALACEIVSRRDGPTGKMHQVYIRNTSGQNIELAAIAANPPRLAPWKSTDTYSSPYILSGESEYFPIFTGEITKASGRSKEIGHLALRQIIEDGNWDNSKMVVLKPGEVLSARAGVSGEPPTKVAMTFFRLIEGKFTPTTATWTPSQENP